MSDRTTGNHTMGDRFTRVLGDRRGAGGLASEDDARDSWLHPWSAYGPNGKAVAEFLELVTGLTEEQYRRLANAAPSPSASDHEHIAWNNVLTAVTRGNWLHATAVNDALAAAFATSDHGWDWRAAVMLVAQRIADALMVKADLSAIDFDTVAAPWRSAIGPLPGDEA